jgi:hypothetical protein
MIVDWDPAELPPPPIGEAPEGEVVELFPVDARELVVAWGADWDREALIANAVHLAELGFGIVRVYHPLAADRCSCGGPHDGSGRTGLGPDSIGKHPIGDAWQANAVHDPELVRVMMGNPGNRSFGIVPPPGTFGWDVDGTAPGILAKLAETLGPLPETRRHASGNGEHAFYRWPEGVPGGSGNLFRIVTRWAPGGMVVAPGSIHASTGKLYRVAADVPIAELPRAWAEAAARPAVAPKASGLRITIDCLACGHLRESYGKNERYPAVASLTLRLHTMGHAPEVQWEHVRDHLAPRFDPPKAEAELRGDFERATADKARMDKKASDWQADHPATSDGEAELGSAEPIAQERPWPEPRSGINPAAALIDEWRIDGLIRPARLCVIAAAEGVGKSHARLEAGIRLATGHGALFGHYRIAMACRVLSIDVENGEEEETRREEEVIARLGLTRAHLADYWGVSLEGLSLTDAGDQAYIREAIERSRPDVVFFDTGSSMVGDEWGVELKSAIRFLRRLAREYGCAVVVLVHLVKPARPANGRASRKPAEGSQHGTSLADVMGQWTRQADTVALMAPAGAERVLWTVRKRAPHSQLVLRAEGGTFDVLQIVAGEDLGVGTMERVHGCIATGYADAASIATYLEVTERTVWRHVAKLRQAGRIAPDGALRLSVPVSGPVSAGSERE